MTEHSTNNLWLTILLWALSSFLIISIFLITFFIILLLINKKKRLFEAEKQDLFSDLQSLPKNAALRELNDLLKRARLVKVRMLVLFLLLLENWKTIESKFLIVSFNNVPTLKKRYTRTSSALWARTFRIFYGRNTRRRNSSGTWARFMSNCNESTKFHQEISPILSKCRWIKFKCLRYLSKSIFLN